jgi:hypothetical protein
MGETDHREDCSERDSGEGMSGLRDHDMSIPKAWPLKVYVRLSFDEGHLSHSNISQQTQPIVIRTRRQTPTNTNATLTKKKGPSLQPPMPSITLARFILKPLLPVVLPSPHSSADCRSALDSLLLSLLFQGWLVMPKKLTKEKNHTHRRDQPSLGKFVPFLLVVPAIAIFERPVA